MYWLMLYINGRDFLVGERHSEGLASPFKNLERVNEILDTFYYTNPGTIALGIANTTRHLVFRTSSVDAWETVKAET